MSAVAMMDGGMMAVMGVWALLLLATALAVLVAAVLGSVWFVRALRAHRGRADRTQHGSDASDVLRRRYSSGEIDEDEYQRRLSKLSQR